MLTALVLGLFVFIAVEVESGNETDNPHSPYETTTLFKKQRQKLLFPSKINGSGNNKNILLHGNCDNIELYESRGSISSPGYPSQYQNHSSCSWTIRSTHHDEITISFDDLDLEEDCVDRSETNTVSCCSSNWIKISNFESEVERKFCGRSEDNRDILKTYTDRSGHVMIKFHVTNSLSSGRGFHLTYSVTPSRISRNNSFECKSDEFKCSNGKCILNKWRCNRRNECEDNSDEDKCDNLCTSANEVRCDVESQDSSSGCYLFPSQRCNGIWDCSNGEDEKGCGGCPSGMFLCPSEKLCYSEAKRCNGEINCRDFSDELNCGLCGPNKTQCSP
ncbi:low-density lipoprotein receptor-related protein 3-like protein, partial [Leptotrombidium deliense]